MTIAKALSTPPTLNTTLSAPGDARARPQVRIASYTHGGAHGPERRRRNNGPIIGQPIVLDTGANQEVVTVKRQISPLPAAPAPNVELSAPLAKDHAAGTATNLNNVILAAPLTKAQATGAAVADPQPLITAAKATELRTLLADAKTKADAGDTAAAIAALEAFKRRGRGLSRPLLSAGEALIAQLRGTPVDTTGTGVTVEAAEDGVQAIRDVLQPGPVPRQPVRDLQDPRQWPRGWLPPPVDRRLPLRCSSSSARRTASTSRSGTRTSVAARAVRRRPASRCPRARSWTGNTLKQYKTIVFNSTVGINGSATINAVEFANLQRFVREGGGVIAIHGGIDSMQNVPWFMDLVGAGFTNHGSNQGGILIETESGGHVELVNADRPTRRRPSMPPRFFTVEELYNTNRNPAELGIVHPLMYENEDSLVGQLGYGAGALHNSDRHAMTWCRNFDGGRSFTTTLGHNWQFTTETWWRDMLLNAVQWTAGQEYSNCVTFNEVKDLLDKAAADGNVTAAGNTALSAALASADAAYRADDFAGAAASCADVRRRRPSAWPTPAPTAGRRCSRSSPRAPSSWAG